MQLPITQADLDRFSYAELQSINSFLQSDADAFNLLDNDRFVTELDGEWIAVIGENNFYFLTEAEAIAHIEEN